jgi:large subunit ribosomal protein L35
MRRKAGKRHILTSKARARKRRLSAVAVVDSTNAYAILRQLPYQS